MEKQLFFVEKAVFILWMQMVPIRVCLWPGHCITQDGPDGNWIVFDGQQSGVFELFIIRSDGTEKRQLTFDPKGPGAYNKCPSWSPEGDRIVFFSTDCESGTNPGANIFIIHVDGSDETAITYGPNEINNGGLYPDWSRLPSYLQRPVSKEWEKRFQKT